MANKFKFDTSWVVITGAPSSGKTSVIDELSKRGYPIQTEVARELIEECLRHGMTLAEIRGAGYVQEMQRKILRFKLAREMALDTSKLVFADRGTPDSLVYFRLAGLDHAAAVEASHVYHYRAVFMLDRLPLVKDGVRTENDAQAEKIGQHIADDYRSLGYEPVAVPVLPVPDRVDFILDHLRQPHQNAAQE